MSRPRRWCASMKSCSRPSFTRTRTMLKAVMILPSAWARSHFISSGSLLGNTVPVASQLLLSLRTGPDAVLAVEGRSASDLLFRDVGVIALKRSVIGQHLPRERQMMDADPQE